jgi:hypothetical protein
MDFTIISQPSTYYKKRVDLRVFLSYARKIKRNFYVTLLLFIVFLILFVDQDTAGLPVKVMHGEHLYYILEEPYRPRVYISGLIVLFSLLILLYTIFERYRYKRYLLRSEKRIVEESDQSIIHFTDNGIHITEYDVSCNFQWSYFSSITIAYEFVIITDYNDRIDGSLMMPRMLFTDEQLDELRNKIKKV